MFTVWRVLDRRVTLDMDFLANIDNHIAGIEQVVKDVCNAPVVSGGLVFDSKSVKGFKIKENADYEGVRVRFLGFLERSRLPMQIDVGFGDAIYPLPKMIDYPVILDFPKPYLKGYPAESVVSEKFEAMVKLGTLNSRMKDFYDIWLLMRRFNFDGLKLSGALNRTFKRRKTILPKAKPLFAGDIYDDKSDRQMLWKAFLKKEGIKNMPDKLSIIAKEIEDFLIKPLEAISE